MLYIIYIYLMFSHYKEQEFKELEILYKVYR